MTNLALDLREAAQMYPDRPAVRLDDTTVSATRELDDLSARAAGWLRSRGLRPGERGGHHAAQRAAVPRLLLRRAARRAAPSSR